ncbi:hypothetical protein DL89DRAFT_253678 [Linderina pennispora]|uniref:Uncharacterized protein n=1 Tax=Linderina pennispora TaxID=61395 RepID=A0A1Y1WJT7_9FUNG|nr:uncharacterized protein DL89DRAFT_253678 [Linderina pennispora]ORX73742.1 hypothetical protein DL89DRAFT_253678 [Linderina pennispora]
MCSELASKTVFLLKGLQVPEQVADSLDAFILLDAAVHIDVLYWLSECTIMYNTAVKELIDSESEKAKRVTTADEMDTQLVRLQPFGEISKQRYWMFGNKTRQLYLEGGSRRTRNKFELLAQTVDEFERVADELEAGRLRVHKELAERIREEVVPFVEKQALRKEKLERKLERNARQFANVHVYETRTRRRQRVNYDLNADPYGVENY